ncbi:NAD(P)-binding protein [Schizophyllum commune H4-8]|uniref:NAD(P)-binding protein n=1 Tax=Schizophyllum commune (strain H4-8 / FGSC 9210) TaxID=578458 RepID=D8QJ52_SCHCM|nr:NAD(P)-binding protein [Schizophyllum commune H4-8]KAI5886483.1 NAD(P)-binding protein [Schizophyllum commune H4-8]
MGQTWSECLPPPPTWTAADVPDLTGKIALVTGGNSGIGKETVRALLEHNATVYLAARDETKAKGAVDELKEATCKEARFLKLDLADLKAVKAAAEEFSRRECRLDILFNSAGVMMCPVELCTADGYDLQFGTNVLGHFYLTRLLLPALLASRRETGSPARVITTSSITHRIGRIDFATLRDSPRRRRKFTQTLYFQSKLGDILIATELQRRYSEQGLVSIPVNPGNLDSDLFRHLPQWAVKLFRPVLYPPPMGALTQLYAGTAPEAESLGGKYLQPWARLGKAQALAHDEQLAREVWAWCEEQVENL